MTHYVSTLHDNIFCEVKKCQQQEKKDALLIQMILMTAVKR